MLIAAVLESRNNFNLRQHALFRRKGEVLVLIVKLPFYQLLFIMTCAEKNTILARTLTDSKNCPTRGAHKRKRRQG